MTPLFCSSDFEVLSRTHISPTPINNNPSHYLLFHDKYFSSAWRRIFIDDNLPSHNPHPINFHPDQQDMPPSIESGNNNGGEELLNFHHPFTPYDVQLEFMRVVYGVLKKGDGQIGILESPTGTVKRNLPSCLFFYSTILPRQH